MSPGAPEQPATTGARTPCLLRAWGRRGGHAGLRAALHRGQVVAISRGTDGLEVDCRQRDLGYISADCGAIELACLSHIRPLATVTYKISYHIVAARCTDLGKRRPAEHYLRERVSRIDGGDTRDKGNADYRHTQRMTQYRAAIADKPEREAGQPHHDKVDRKADHEDSRQRLEDIFVEQFVCVGGYEQHRNQGQYGH